METLIHPWKDLAPGNFIMQMRMSAPVPVTVLKRTQAARGWQDAYGLAELSIHLQEACHHRYHYSGPLISCSYPLSSG